MDQGEEIRQEMERVEYDGEPVRLGKKWFIVPSLSVKRAKQLWPEIIKLDATGLTPENLPEKRDTVLTIIHAALTRNYPNLSKEELEDKVDLGNIRHLMLIASAQSGFKPGEPKPAAEKIPVL